MFRKKKMERQKKRRDFKCLRHAYLPGFHPNTAKPQLSLPSVPHLTVFISQSATLGLSSKGMGFSSGISW